MNVDTLLNQYFSSADNLHIEMFDSQNILKVYRRLVHILMQQPEVETSLLQGMSYCFYEIMDNVLIHSGKQNGIVMTKFCKVNNLIQILVADDGIGIRSSLAKNESFKNISEEQALEYCIQDKVSDGNGMGFGLYSTSRLINTAGHRLDIRSGYHTLSANGAVHVAETDFWQGTIVYFELISDKDIDPHTIVEYRTDPVEEFNTLFLDQDENNKIDQLW